MVRRAACARMLAIAGVGGLLAACSGGGAPPDAFGVFDTRGLDTDAAEVSQPKSALPPAMLRNEPVTWNDLHPLLVEMAGPAALNEVVLERELNREFAARGLVLSDEAVRQEEDILLQTMAREARTTPDEAARLLESMRASRGLGPVRFAAMLRRNAMLRALATEGVTVDDADVKTAYAVRYGPKVRVRVIVVPTQRQAGELRSKLQPGTPEAPRPHLALEFADAAAKFSTDPSAARGGSLPPMSLEDPTYPAAARDALRPLQPGQVTRPFAAPGGFAFFLLEERVDEASPPPEEEVAGELRLEVTRVRERLAMDDLARRMLDAAPLRVHDRGLEGARGK